MKEYNNLTKRLLAEGYTETNYPDYVQLPTGTLNNPYGGFEYKRYWIYEKIFKTPCGLQCKGENCLTGLYCMGIEYTFENNNALAECPYDKKKCELTKTLNTSIRTNCPVHMIDEEYEYEGSIEGIQKLQDDEIEREKTSFILQKNGRICENHMHYDKEKKEWNMHYDPSICANMGCSGNCPVLGRKLDKKKGNVYYDIKTTGRRYDLDGTLFEGQIDIVIQKGKRMFKSPVSMDICNVYMKFCKDKIRDYVKMKYHSELFFAKYYNRYFKVEVLNIRAESRPSRNLEQDLEDIKNGIRVFHESDTEKKRKEQKKERREESKQKKIEGPAR